MRVKRKYLACRALMHAWGFYDVATVNCRRGAAYEQVLCCSRCGVCKTWFLDRRGDIISTSYSYPEDYQIAGGLKKEERVEVRKSLVELMIKTTANPHADRPAWPG